MAGRGRKALPEGRVGLRGVIRPSQRAGSGQEDLPEGQEWSGGPHGGLSVV